MDENTSFYYNNGVGTVYGWNGATVVNVEGAFLDPKPYLVLSNITGHYLSAGDKFDLKTGTVISNRTLIGTPAYSGPTDSSDITKAY